MARHAKVGVFALLVLIACNGSSEPAIPGLDPGEEIELVEVDPDPSDDFYVWTHALQVEDLPPVNVGQPTAQFLEDAARVDDDPEDYVCFGDASGSGGCDVEDPESPSVGGLGFGGLDVMAWSWNFVPDGAAAVRFTDQTGQTSWQRPVERMVIFPDTVDDSGDSVVDCACRLDAIAEDGGVIISVDVDLSAYIDG